MTKNEKKKMTKLNKGIDHIPDITKMGSATEYAGLMPTPPQNDWERENYEDVFPIETAEQA